MKVNGKFTDMFKHVIKRTNVLRNIFFSLTLMTLGAGNAWAQGLSGIYYIASDKGTEEEKSFQYNTSTTEERFYIVPAKDPILDDKKDAYYSEDYGTSDGDPGKPYLTTYRTNRNVNSAWVFKSAGDNKYFFIHVLTGKYAVYHTTPDCTSKNHRKVIHLETLPNPESVDIAKFYIENGTTTYTFRPQSLATGHRFFNPSNGNKEFYNAQGGDCNNAGLIGVYNDANDRGSKWHLETALLAAPTINTTSYPTVTVTDSNGLPEGYNIRYTFGDGTQAAPTAESPIMEGGTYTVTEGGTLKVVIERYGIVLTEVASKQVGPTKPTFTINADGSVSISATGETIYYTLDGNNPTTSSTAYSSTISASDIASAGTAIKAIAVDGSGIVSQIAELPLISYTYKILNKAGDVAIQKTVKQPVGKALTTYTDIPADIRSPYLAGEEVKFYNRSAASDEYKIDATNSEDNEIWVTYTTTHLMGKFLHLRGARALNVTLNGEYISDSGTNGSGIFARNSTPTDDEKASSSYLWYFSGEDPYAIEIKNAGTNNYWGYDTPSGTSASLTLVSELAKKKFILMSGSADPSSGTTYERMELMAATSYANYYRVKRTGDAFSINKETATGDASLQVLAYPNSSSITYRLIDKAGKVLLEVTSKSESVDMPDGFKSPLVDEYQYWKSSAFNIEGDTYTLKESPEESDKIKTITDATDGVIYVTYRVNNRVLFDETDDDAVGSIAYRLQYINGEYFRQENGKDGVMASPQKAVYPYSNGDAMLYVYGVEQWNTQLASGASTRNRWLWYVVSPNSDPYHVKIMSNSAQASSHNYFRTYVVNYGGSNHVVTGVTTKNEAVDSEHANQLPTEYMVLTGQNGHCKLVTLNTIDDGTTTERRTVTSFEQYWKNNPTTQNLLGASSVTSSESVDDNGIVLTSTQQSLLPSNWHTYQAWANAAPWVSWSDGGGGSGKKYHNKHHWFQTINMATAAGSQGEFEFVETSLEPQVILLDKHGWEIMRKPLSQTNELRKYDSPMVKTYHWYPTATKAAGYHKYTVDVDNPGIQVYYSYEEGGKTKWAPRNETYTHTSTTLADSPYDHINSSTNPEWEEQPASVKTDFYVTYDVDETYERLYTGAARKEDVKPSAFLVKQGDDYAKIVGTSLGVETTLPETISEEMQWYLRTNFDIDREMGYLYDGQTGAQDDALSKDETEAAYVSAGQNGFDPYNVQIQNVSNTNRYFTTTATGSHLTGGAWEGTSTDLTLENLSFERQHPEGNDQTTLNITNATFMVVKDASGHTLLMPRFDNTKVVNSLTEPRLSAANAATKSVSFIPSPKLIHYGDELSSLNGQYILAADFDFTKKSDGTSFNFQSLGSGSAPFTGSIDGGGHTFTGLSVPLLAYADGAIVKNLILDNEVL